MIALLGDAGSEAFLSGIATRLCEERVGQHFALRPLARAFQVRESGPADFKLHSGFQEGTHLCQPRTGRCILRMLITPGHP